MAELAFPLAGALVLLFVAIPFATLLCKVLLVALRKLRPAHERSGSTARYLLIVSPVLIPVGWLASAAAHHAEEGRAALACLLHHIANETCQEPLILLSLLCACLLAVIVRSHHRATRDVPARRRVADAALVRRLDRLARLHPQLAAQRRCVCIVDGDDLRTVGLFHARVEIGQSAASRLDDAALAGALLHELEHLRGRDPLRIVLAAICEALNPLAFLLAPELRRWRAGRELACDAAAVDHGADPLALADALVTLSRPTPSRAPLAAAHLGGGGMALLRLRVAILLGSTRAPARRPSSPIAPKTAAALVLLVGVLPHWLDAWPLGQLHRHSESVLLQR